MVKLNQALSMRAKIIGIVGLLMGLMLMAVIVADRSMETISVELRHISGEDMHLTSAITDITDWQLGEVAYFERVLRYAGVVESNPDLVAQAKDKALETFGNYHKKIRSRLGDSVKITKTALENARTESMRLEFSKILAQRNFPMTSIHLFASDRSAGRKLSVGEREIEVEEATPDSFRGIDIAFFSASAENSHHYSAIAVESGAAVIDSRLENRSASELGR